MTPFSFDHVFSARSQADVFEAFFDAAHQSAQDRAVAISERETLELVDRGDELYRVMRVVPRRQLPAFLQPFASGPLHYLETQLWRRSQDTIEIDIRPSLLRGRARIRATYRLDAVAPGSIRRRYAGEVSVDVALLSTRIERGIVAEFERSMPLATACTQTWLDKRTSVVAARA